MDDTIAAISTPIGAGGIAIIRVSGPQALRIADALFVAPAGKPSTYRSHTIHHGEIRGNGDLIDEVMLAVMHAPRSYTSEDVVEINCHGGLVTARRVLEHCLAAGARLAEPGEFTKRAFLNGRIDLIQAEAVMDLIQAKTELAQQVAAHALEGHLTAKINEVRDQLLRLLAELEAHIDFPEEEVPAVTLDAVFHTAESLQEAIAALLATSREGKILRDGISAVIVGRPNSGKSSLMNRLLGEDRSIVTPIPGTTRDTIEEYANIHGIPLRLIDTAGIREPRGTIENLGVTRSRNELRRSEIVLYVIDGSRAFSKSEWDLVKLCEHKPVVLVINKTDLPRKLHLPDGFCRGTEIEISALTGQGMENLRSAIEGLGWSGCAGHRELDVVVNERQAESLRRASLCLTEAINELQHNSPVEIVSQQLRMALSAIGEIVGKTTTEDLLEAIFSRFCIGK